MTPERHKLWSAFETRQRQSALPSHLIISGYGGLGITMGGSPTSVVIAAQRHVRIMQEIEPKLDDPAYVKGLYGETGAPASPSFVGTTIIWILAYSTKRQTFSVSSKRAPIKFRALYHPATRPRQITCQNVKGYRKRYFIRGCAMQLTA